MWLRVLLCHPSGLAISELLSIFHRISQTAPSDRAPDHPRWSGSTPNWKSETNADTLSEPSSAVESEATPLNTQKPPLSASAHAGKFLSRPSNGRISPPRRLLVKDQPTNESETEDKDPEDHPWGILAEPWADPCPRLTQDFVTRPFRPSPYPRSKVPPSQTIPPRLNLTYSPPRRWLNQYIPARIDCLFPVRWSQGAPPRLEVFDRELIKSFSFPSAYPWSPIQRDPERATQAESRHRPAWPRSCSFPGLDRQPEHDQPEDDRGYGVREYEPPQRRSMSWAGWSERAGASSGHYAQLQVKSVQTHHEHGSHSRFDRLHSTLRHRTSLHSVHYDISGADSAFTADEHHYRTQEREPRREEGKIYAPKRVRLDSKVDEETLRGYVNDMQSLKRLDGSEPIIKFINSQAWGGGRRYLTMVMETGEIGLAWLLAEKRGTRLQSH
ncbi:unnamed protein product [Rhizoctonia solani]|uniref:Uncharacterized protein n=1 Tax=Rhizoctonia solani TaxID=456999 RepID=A0A8H2Y0V9_9AGAM|nr:unnamed protein product [Rhizoctonia solani]